MTPRDAALRTATLRALADLVKEHADVARTDLQTVLVEIAELTGQPTVKAVLPDGTAVATLTLAAGRATPKVVDEQAFLAWVAEKHPGEVEQRVRDSFRRRVLDDVEKTGEVPPGVEMVPGSPYVSCRFAPEGRAAVARAWAAGELPDPILQALPVGGAG